MYLYIDFFLSHGDAAMAGGAHQPKYPMYKYLSVHKCEIAITMCKLESINFHIYVHLHICT